MKFIDEFMDKMYARLDVIGGKLKDREIVFPTELVGAGIFFVFALAMLIMIPRQITVSESDVVNGRVFPRMLMYLTLICCFIIFIQNLIKAIKKQDMTWTKLNLLVEIKAFIILAILFLTFIICKTTDLFVLGAIFCSLSFLVFFRCRKRFYYLITICFAILIWVAFRFGLGVRF